MGTGHLIEHKTRDLGAEATCTHWGAWGPPVKIADNPRMFQQCRSMHCRMEWWTQEVYFYEGDLECPAGYTLQGAACTPDDGDGASVSPRRGDPVEFDAEPVHHWKVWDKEDCRYWSNWAAIKDASLKRSGRPLDPLAVVFAKSIPPNGKFTIRGLPRNSSILVNGERVRGRTIDMARLPRGLSVIGIVSNDAETEDRISLGLNVVSPLEIVVREPLVSAADGSEPVRFSLQVRNRSDADQLVRLAISAVPPGWRAHVVGEPIRLLGPNQSATVRIHARRWSGGGRKSPLLPFSLQASSVKNERFAAAATVYMQRP